MLQLVALAAGFEHATEQDTLDRIADYEERKRHWKQALAGQQLLSSVMFVYGTQKAYGALSMQIDRLIRCITGDFPGQADRHAETIERVTHPLKLQQVRPSRAPSSHRVPSCAVFVCQCGSMPLRRFRFGWAVQSCGCDSCAVACAAKAGGELSSGGAKKSVCG